MCLFHFIPYNQACVYSLILHDIVIQHFSIFERLKDYRALYHRSVDTSSYTSQYQAEQKSSFLPSNCKFVVAIRGTSRMRPG